MPISDRSIELANVTVVGYRCASQDIVQTDSYRVTYLVAGGIIYSVSRDGHCPMPALHRLEAIAPHSSAPHFTVIRLRTANDFIALVLQHR